MFRHIAIFVVGTVAIANLNAGSVQIQIGGANGLTTAQASGNITSTQSGPLPYSATVLQGTGSNANNAITSGVLCYGFAPTATTSCTAGGGTLQTNLPFTATNPAGGAYFSAQGGALTFAMINQSNASEWTTTNLATGTSTINIPMGIFGVTNVDTMLNDNFGVPNSSDISVTFNFAGALGGGNSAGSETFTLIDGEVIRDSFRCTGGNTGNTPSCLSYLNGGGADPLATANIYNQAGTLIGPVGTSTAVPYVNAFNVISGTYTAAAGAVPYVGTNGNLYLDAQNFNLGTNFLGDYLTSMTITDTVTAQDQSRAELSAITVFASAPEPSTVFLFLTGIGAVVLIHRRRKSASVTLS